jgi:CubicO group peptidase (beta-lactamase class C family)
MKRRTLLALVAGVGILASGEAPAQTPSWSLPPDAAIREVLVKRIDTDEQGVGIVVGVIDGRGRRIIAYGARNQGDARPLDGDTLFEIGSMTKVFTSLLLEQAVLRHEVKLDDPVVKYLPSGVHVPERGGKQITLIDLATHTSGLPRLPSNLAMSNPDNPYADYTAAQLYQFLGGYELTRDIGSRYEYSNLGAGLLGDALSRRAGLSYEALVRRDVLGPLRMESTTVTLSPALSARMAVGHNGGLDPVPNWDLPALAGAGALRSDANDMLSFLAAELGYSRTPLADAMKAQWSPRRPTTIPNTEVSLAWHVRKTATGEVIWHNGGTGGFRTFMGFDPAGRFGVVVLTNAATVSGGDDIGFWLLTGSPLTPQPKRRHAIHIEAAALQPFVGRYQLAPTATLTITREGDHLFGQITGQTRFEIFAEKPNEFFWKVVDAQLTFQTGPDGVVTGAVLHQAGANLPAPRLP